jgi:hypothetical protein
MPKENKGTNSCIRITQHYVLMVIGTGCIQLDRGSSTLSKLAYNSGPDPLLQVVP